MGPRDRACSYRVLLADDHEVILDTARLILAPEFEVVGAVRDGAAVLEAASCLDPDVLLLDITMPSLSGLDAARRLKASGSRIKIVFLTVHEDQDYVREALEAGAAAYVVKATMASDLPRAIHEALEGRNFISPSISFGDAEADDRHR
jgi:DNA-binding NarL/FixJ family response regulator